MPIHSAIGFSTGHRNHQSTGQIKAAIIFLNFPASACNANLNLQTRGPRQPNRMRTWRARRGERRRTRWWTAAAGGGGVSWLPQTVLSKFCVAQSRRRRRLPAPPPPPRAENHLGHFASPARRRQAAAQRIQYLVDLQIIHGLMARLTP
jgi:hypothetical protein